MPFLVSLDEARAYLRLDSHYDDALVESFLSSSEAICRDMARLDSNEWENIISISQSLAKEEDSSEEGDSLSSVLIRGEERSIDEIKSWVDLLRMGVLFTCGYLYEHREEADHHDLMLTLRNLLYSIREGVF